MGVAYFPLRADDAYIVGRYVLQLQAENGLVYNAGERINALTSPAHVFLLAALGLATDRFVDLGRVASALIAGGVAVGLAVQRWGPNFRTALYLALVVSSPFAVFWSVGGLETPLLFAVCAAIAFVSTGTPPKVSDSNRRCVVILLGALALMLRFDAALFVIPVSLVSLWAGRGDRRVWRAVAVSASVFGSWLVFSFVYFGDLLPTSFYVKATVSGTTEALAGAIYVGSFALLSWLCIPLMAVAPQMIDANRRVERSALLCGVVAIVIYALWMSTKHMMYLYRLLVPYLPVVAYLVVHRTRPLSSFATHAMLASVLLLQAALAMVIFYQSQNPSIALLWEGRSERHEMFEFSHLGSRHTAEFLDSVRLQAVAIRNHWHEHGSPKRPPRLLVSTGGYLPYLLPTAYVFEKLVSYRHHCTTDLVPAADYFQVIYPLDRAAALDEERTRLGRQVISRATIIVDGLRQEPLSLVIDIWFRRAEANNPLPPRINGSCAIQ